VCFTETHVTSRPLPWHVWRLLHNNEVRHENQQCNRSQRWRSVLFQCSAIRMLSTSSRAWRTMCPLLRITQSRFVSRRTNFAHYLCAFKSKSRCLEKSQDVWNGCLGFVEKGVKFRRKSPGCDPAIRAPELQRSRKPTACDAPQSTISCDVTVQLYFCL